MNSRGNMPEPTPADLFQRALAAHRAGRLEEAERLYRQILADEPQNADAIHGLGVIALHVGRAELAADLFNQAIRLAPGFSAAYSNLGVALMRTGRPADAIAACRKAVMFQPDSAAAQLNLGNALRSDGQIAEAIEACRDAVALAPRSVKALCSLGNALSDNGLLGEAIAAYRQATVLEPDFADAHHHLGLAVLLAGNFHQGWREYDWRWKCGNFPSARWNFPQPRWDGSDLAGRTLLLHAEQGYGDTLQFIRYLPLLDERGGAVIVQCQSELSRLLKVSFPEHQFVAPGESIPAFDVHCPMLSVPGMFTTTAEEIPSSHPYLRAPEADLNGWRERLSALGPGLKIGLVWAGSTGHINDANRSVQLAAFSPLLECPDAHFISLQKGASAVAQDEAQTFPNFVDWTCELQDFADTAALVANLDLVISVDTAVAHLAGALGKPVWTLLAFAPDWRWMLHRNDSPWYPTMRLFRQPSPGDWGSVVAGVCEQLGRLKGSAAVD